MSREPCVPRCVHTPPPFTSSTSLHVETVLNVVLAAYVRATEAPYTPPPFTTSSSRVKTVLNVVFPDTWLRLFVPQKQPLPYPDLEFTYHLRQRVATLPYVDLTRGLGIAELAVPSTLFAPWCVCVCVCLCVCVCGVSCTE